MILTEKVVATVGTQKYAFRSTKGLYEGAIATATGIAKWGEADQALPILPIAPLLQAGAILKRTAMYMDNGIAKYFTVYVAAPKASSAKADLLDKSFSFQKTNSQGTTVSQTGTIKNVVERLSSTAIY